MIFISWIVRRIVIFLGWLFFPYSWLRSHAVWPVKLTWMGMAQDLFLSPLIWGLQYCGSGTCLSCCHFWKELWCRILAFFIVSIAYLCMGLMRSVLRFINICFCTIILVLCCWKIFVLWLQSHYRISHVCILLTKFS